MSKWFLNSKSPKSHALSLFIVVQMHRSEPLRESRLPLNASVGKKNALPPSDSFLSQVPKGFRIMRNLKPRLPKVVPCIVLEGGPEMASAGISGKNLSSRLRPQEDLLVGSSLTECTLISKISLKGLNAFIGASRTERSTSHP
ncbi:conserved hypothetical protein [Neospora caninum Liverpool]|uniref:Uncharacterized protein n=1 Tax=Neospora caninum (strain Liverpool) TaxID=572307 RepID=F0VHT1_NEOCL|nr:conserved hypothetical protein [Neospora caninum Liverpool]CBZ53292.1 conserved hypothetical protein [Neospora caninum Liverpool]CEL67278.1 TPA: hypothetical protein BN1204_030790 [Neospora caninum Liverpool]|eukprot:XP_003883324.1 conserved hypothetical protein [Neospora caninum Liverpool]